MTEEELHFVGSRRDKLLWDTNTMRKGLQRNIFSCMMEIAGSEILVTEQTATELSRLFDPRDPDESVRRLYKFYEDPGSLMNSPYYRPNPRERLRHQIWWAEELTNSDGIYRVAVMNEEQQKTADALMESFAHAKIIHGLDEDAVRQHPDAILICQTAALGGYLLISPDKDFDSRHLAANRWALDMHRQGKLPHRTLLRHPRDEVQAWAIHAPNAILRAVLGAAWPTDPRAPQTAVEKEFSRFLTAMEKIDYFRGVSRLCRERYTEEIEPCRLIESVRRSLPVRTRAADRRHPANPGNTRSNWSAPAGAGEIHAPLPYWRISIIRDRFVLERKTEGKQYTIAESIPLRERKRIADTLIERGIEVDGLPPHGGRKDDASAFAIALNNAIDAELSRSRK